MIQTERDNRKKRIKTMKKAKKWGKHRQIFEKEHANGALRASPSTTPHGLKASARASSTLPPGLTPDGV